VKPIRRSKFQEAIPSMIKNLHRGYTLTRVATEASVNPRILRINLRKGQKATQGPLRELYLAEIATRDRRPWGQTSGPGKAFPRPSARTLAQRAEWEEVMGPSLLDDPVIRRLVRRLAGPTEERAFFLTGYDSGELSADELSQLLSYSAPDELRRERGRPSKLTFKRIEDIAIAVRYGSSLAGAAVGVGLYPRTLLKYLTYGKTDPKGLCTLLADRVAEARKQRIRPPELATIESAVTVEDDRVQPYRSLTLPELSELRRRTRVRFALGHRYLPKPIMVELRWPKARAALNSEQRELLARGLRVLARDVSRSLRELYFFNSLPLR
jgi:hypothetical protein